MIGDLYIYSNTFNGDTSIVDLSPNNHTISLYGAPYHITSYTSITPRIISNIMCGPDIGFGGNTEVTLGLNTDFTFDIYISYLYNNTYEDLTFGNFGYISFLSREKSSNFILKHSGSILYGSNITSPCLLTISRTGTNLKLFRDGVSIASLSNVDVGTSSFGIMGYATKIINTIRIINGTGLYADSFPMPTFPYTDGESITGTVTENTIGVVRTIRLYNRESGILVYTTTSNADGTYEIPILNNDIEYDVLFLDDTPGTIYNDIVKRTSLI